MLLFDGVWWWRCQFDNRKREGRGCGNPDEAFGPRWSRLDQPGTGSDQKAGARSPGLREKWPTARSTGPEPIGGEGGSCNAYRAFHLWDAQQRHCGWRQGDQQERGEGLLGAQ